MPRALPFVTVTALVAAACAGCVHKPEVHIDHYELNGVQLATMPPSLGVVMTIVLRVTNPNSYDVAVRGVRGQTVLGPGYTLPVQFQAQGDGVWLPADQTTPVRVPMTIPVDMALAILQQSFTQPTIPYHFTGTADVTATRTFQLEKDNYSVDESGQITRADMMNVVPGALVNPLFPQPR